MTIFVDASALVSITVGEADAPAIEDALAADPRRLTSAIALWEAARAVSRLAKGDIEAATAQVERTRVAAQLLVIPISAAEAVEAVRAHARYGKGTGHPAKLNMGDCFAYACAKTKGARLLYKGDDFARTDLA